MVTKTGKSIEFRERSLMTSDCRRRVGKVVQNGLKCFLLVLCIRTGDSFKIASKSGYSNSKLAMPYKVST